MTNCHDAAFCHWSLVILPPGVIAHWQPLPTPANSSCERPSPAAGIGEDPRWYKHAVIYQLQVRTFYDGNGDGIGEFLGLIRKLDYLQELGVTAIWLLPFYPSPMKDGGYDITDFKAIHPDYGTLKDFRAVLHEAHRRGLRVMAEMVLNHTSDQHPWFQRARQASAGSRWAQLLCVER